jgi:hypothetical protein
MITTITTITITTNPILDGMLDNINITIRTITMMIIITAIIKRHKQLYFTKNTGDKQTMRRGRIILGFTGFQLQLQSVTNSCRSHHNRDRLEDGWKAAAVLKAIQENGIRSDKCIFFY